MTWEITSYWDTNMFYHVLQAVALMLNNAGYYQILILGVTLGSFFAIIGSMIGKGSPVDIAKHVLIGALMFYILVIPRTTVTIIDKSFLTQSSAPMTISDIPVSLAFLAYTTSALGDWVNTEMDAFFSLPDDLKKSGTHMTRKILLETILTEPENARFLHNMTEYTRECVLYDLNSGAKNIDEIRNAPNTWDALGETNPALLVSLTVPDGSGGYYDKVYTCPEAYNDELRIELKTVYEGIQKTAARSTFPGRSDVAAQAAFAAVETSAMSTFMQDSSRSASEYFKNTVTQNSFLKSLGAITGDTLSVSRAVIGVDAGANQKAQLAKSFIYAITIIQLLVYAFFPIVILIVVFAGVNGLKPLSIVVKVLVWLALVQASQIILDNLILLNTADTTSKLVADTGAGSINAWLSAGGVINGMQDQLQNALFASFGLSWMLLSGATSFGGSMASGLFQGAQTYNERTATDTAAEGRNNFGDVKWNNTGFNNTSANTQQTAPDLKDLGGSFNNSDGSVTNVSGSGNVFMDLGSPKNKGGVITSSIASAIGQQAEQSSRNEVAASLDEQRQASSQVSQVMGRALDNSRMSNVLKSMGLTYGKAKSYSSGEAAEKGQSIAKAVAKSFNVSDEKLNAISTAMYTNTALKSSLGVGADTTFFKASVALASELGIKGENQKRFASALGKALKSDLSKSDQNSLKELYSYVSQGSFNVNEMESWGVNRTEAESIKSSSDIAHSRLESANSSLRESESRANSFARFNRLSKDMQLDVLGGIGPNDYRKLQLAARDGDMETVNEHLLRAMDRYDYTHGFNQPNANTAVSSQDKSDIYGVAYGNNQEILNRTPSNLSGVNIDGKTPPQPQNLHYKPAGNVAQEVEVEEAIIGGKAKSAYTEGQKEFAAYSGHVKDKVDSVNLPTSEDVEARYNKPTRVTEKETGRFKPLLPHDDKHSNMMSFNNKPRQRPEAVEEMSSYLVQPQAPDNSVIRSPLETSTIQNSQVNNDRPREKPSNKSELDNPDAKNK